MAQIAVRGVMNCPNCQQENVSSARFCSQCGARLQAVCPRCAAVLPPAARFCVECGVPLEFPREGSRSPGSPAPEEPPAPSADSLPSLLPDPPLPVDGENRLVTVLFIDMSSSVQTTGDLHPEDAAMLVNRLLSALMDGVLQYAGWV